MNNRLLALLPAGLLLAGTLASGRSAEQTPADRKTVWNGVYTSAQATRGRMAFEANCIECHEGDIDTEEPGARFAGNTFMERWREYTASSLFKFMKGSMPQRKPGSLGDQVYVDIAAFMFQKNAFPAGAIELTQEDLKSIHIEQKDGPKPVPNGALVQLVGCVARDKTSWVLKNSSEPMRTDVSMSSSAEEIKAAEVRPLGQYTFWLQNLEFLGSSFDAATYEGGKVQAKGNIIRQPGKERLDISSMELVASKCGDL